MPHSSRAATLEYSISDDESVDLPPSPTSDLDIVSEIVCGNNAYRFKIIIKCAILSPKNDHCDEVNKRVFDLITGSSKTYTSVNSLITEGKSKLLQVLIEFSNSLEMTSLPSHD